MRNLFARLLVILAILGLPLQALGAVTMILCEHEHDHSAQTQAHDHHAAHDAGHDSSPAPGDDSGPCHHSTAAALPVIQPLVGSDGSNALAPRPLPHRFSFFPEQPKRPPLA